MTKHCTSDVGRGGWRAENVITFERTITKKVVTFGKKKMGVTPSVVPPPA